MKILIEVPTWLGDTVMSTPAIENVMAVYPKCQIILFGSFVSTKIFLQHPNVTQIIVDQSKDKGSRYLNLYRLAQKVGKVDLALSFRQSFSTRFFFWFVEAQKKCIYKRYREKPVHQVVRYNDFVNHCLGTDFTPKKLKIYYNTLEQAQRQKPIVGINPGATYGSAKRWYPQEFAKVAIALSSHYDVVLFGGPGEVEMANDIENLLKNAAITNYQNLAGKTSVEGLIEHISHLNLFITADSGPMHIAAAFDVPTVSIFGPTRASETNQWQNPKSIVVKKDLFCAPCMKRTCPLGHHECMKLITANDVLEAVKKLT
ncbi:MAG TPA: lipopolysaccharide heptosyltransferase II [Sulfurovum sp.]|jgi:heptosyltransferase-2|nr:MAG: lipopolysaccharide heptosyltransferase II [Sulfurovum sp. 35-42-20]OYZ25058.1 MAG: lipopolysaccharide heptosyltransferase II [Sulfurovum sp. 16-42-52]OYZ48966.1 MAG: lipopolysaccharide heptosyltransferase II [Sulfurovum sp. 24-42-9]OZA44825.1 MAG: lipopolysaccharide heptosyltransferase II [Sulfurovum sp. 17-42-90]OZA61106.1 MAG: lipopolysaccharide heptosyltransferase II [Sulfurovum sp. 39-42-12]HQR73596.1 lipopolysaccharide heptosyltransferase II [Sulfurovum sp.]